MDWTLRTMVLLLLGCGPKATAPEASVAPSDIRAQGDAVGMHERLDHLTEARDQLVAGHHDASRQALQWMVENEAPSMAPKDWQPFLQELLDEAAEGAQSTDTGELARAVASSAQACGACHVAQGTVLQFDAVPVPAPEAQMARHVWAADRLWESVLMGSTERWQAAQDVLFDEVIDGSRLYDGLTLETSAHAAALHKRVHDLAGGVAAQTPVADRVGLHGAFLASCSECHALVRGP